MKNKGKVISFEESISKDSKPSGAKEELHQCPCDEACTCAMDEPCLGCETYGAWLNRPSPWISVEDSPKNEECDYIVLINNGEDWTQDRWVELTDPKDNTTYWDWYGSDSEEVTHYMPRPELPE